MDKTFNDLMDIVNRSKKIDGGSQPKPKVRPRPIISREDDYDEEYVPIEYDVVNQPKRSRTVSNAGQDLFGENSAISKLLNKDKKPATKTTKSSKKATSTKSTSKSTTKKSATSKASTKTASKSTTKPAPKKTTTSKTSKSQVEKKVAEPKTVKNVEPSIQENNVIDVSKSNPIEDAKNAKLYEALRESLFSGGTDISEYVEIDENVVDSRKSLDELKAKREANKLNAEISREQQEYEQLFTGSLGNFSQEDNVEEQVEQNISSEKNAQLEKDLDEIRNNLENKKASISMPTLGENRKDATYEIDTGNRDLDKKIADYYRRKQEKISEYKAQEEGYITEEKVEKEEEVDYESIFSGELITRDELLGIEREEESKPAQEDISIENKVEKEEVDNEQYNVVEEKAEESNLQIENENIASKSPNNMEETSTQMNNDRVDHFDDANALEDSLENIEIQRESTSNENEEESKKEEYIKSLLSDLLFSKKEIEEINNNNDVAESCDESNNQDNVVEEIEKPKDIQDETQDDYRTQNYERVWEEGLLTDKEVQPVIQETHADEEIVEETQLDKQEEMDNVSLKDCLSEINEQENSEGNVQDQTNIIKESLINKENSDIHLDTNENTDAIYDLDNKEANIHDYILSDNTPTEEKYDEEFEMAIQNERKYYSTDAYKGIDIDNNPEDSICVVDTLPENKYSVLDATYLDNQEKEDVITREDFYNEMARLQDNIVKELRGRKTEVSTKDFFEEKVEEENRQDDKADDVAQGLIEKLTLLSESDDEDIENDLLTKLIAKEVMQRVSDDEKENEENTIEEIHQKINPVIEETKTITEETTNFEEFNLLNKEEPLNEEDLAYQETKQETNKNKDGSYFYLSPEDNEKKAAMHDEYMTIYDEESISPKEIGDINFFKNINNAVPSSEVLKETKKEVSKNNQDDEVEAIYTLMGIERKPLSKNKEEMKVLYVTSECQPFVASGGLGDVAGSLPNAIAKKDGVDIRVVMPLYGNIKNEYRENFEYIGNFTVHLSWRQEYCGLFRYYKDGVTYYFIDNERYFKRDSLYGYFDDGERYAYFCKAIVESLPYINFFPDIIHCNDWQTALVSAYIKTGIWSDFRYYKIKNIYTIHNVEYQGIYGMENLKDLFGIDYRFRNDLDYNGDINLTKAAVLYSDKFTTVSNSYCDNLKQPYCSRGLHHIIIRHEYKLCGIVNGIDYDFYNPATDTCLFKNYDYACLEDKVLNKKSWQDEMGLPVDGDTPMIAIVSRLVGHKGLDLITKVIEDILQQDIQLVVVGTGDQKYVDYFKYLEDKYPTKVRALVDKYSNENARRAYAASDIFLMPSKVEPCGIAQMISSRYGSVPIVREVGGLKDTIKDFGCGEGGNGYTFANYNPNDLSYQINRALKDYQDKAGWKEKMRTCMSVDFTWDKPAEEYIKLYKSVYDN